MSSHPIPHPHPHPHSQGVPGGRPYMPPQPPQAQNGPARGRARACTSCRQVKLRCDARERAPASCSRCEMNNLECKMDPHFKRVPARRQLEDVAKSLNYLQEALGIDSNQPGPRNLSDYMRRSHRPDLRQLPLPGPSYQASISDESLNSEDHVPQPTSVKFYALIDDTEVGEWTLGDITFNANQIRILFKHFDDTHYKHGPFLEPCNSIHSYYKSSELLFWTVTMISCYLFSDYESYYLRLLPHHRRLLSTKMMENRVTLSTVHAMLCMATWTYPVSTDYDDITWMLCGAAIHTAMIMGLHKPGHSHEFSAILQRDVGSQYTRNITWLSIFIISTGISSWLGMPPPLGAASHLEAIATLCKDLSIPKWYRGRADIHRQTVMLVNSIDSKSSFSARHASIRVYEGELFRVRDTYEDVWNDDLEMEWHGAMLYLYGIAFVSPNPSRATNTPETVIQAKEILLKGLATAVQCIQTVISLELPPTAAGENTLGVEDRVYQMGFYPKHFFRIGAFANYYLLWFIAVDNSASSADRDIARTYITLTYQLLISFSHSPEHQRGGEAIKTLADLPMTMSGPTGSQIQARLGAGFMYSFMTAENRAANAIPNLGIDFVRSEGQAQSRTSGPGEAYPVMTHHSPESTYTTRSSPHFDVQQAQAMQYLQASTPTSTHSMPEPLRPLQQDHRMPITTQPPTSVPSGPSRHNPTAMYNQVSQTSSAGPMGQTPFSGQLDMDLSMYQAAMPTAFGQFAYPGGSWDTGLLAYEQQQEPPAYIGGMNLGGDSDY